jgi:uncharacterized protein (UPF0335 family)|tara:strand:+ start:1142 stop:1375 length:234 start_codon:yes stop_codon:yes gene_type:complete
MMANGTVIKEFADKVMAFDAEKKELAEAEKMLYTEYKDKLDVKAFRAALRIARIRSKLDTTSEAEADQMLQFVADKV